MKKISLCVTGYKRPDTLKQLINSYLKQDYSNKELIISDNTPDDTVKKAVLSYENKSIKYFHNKINLGVARNILASMERATGDYLILLGDDDALLNTHVLSEYVKTFDSHPKVGFIYSNMIQFSNDLKVQYIINFTNKNKLFKKGESAMNNILIRSIFIGGIGIRNIKSQFKFYPTKKMLHPQVEFIGNIINNYDAFLLAKNNIAFRSHEDQIIFRALKDKQERQGGAHMTVEIPEVFELLTKKYKLNLNTDLIVKQLIDLQTVMMLKEKSILGNELMEENYKKFSSQFNVVRNSKKFKLYFILAKIIPGEFIKIIRLLTLNLIPFTNKTKYKEFEEKLKFMLSTQ